MIAGLSLYILSYDVFPAFALDAVGLAGLRGRMSLMDIVESPYPDPGPEYAGIMVHTPEGPLLVYGGFIIESQGQDEHANDDVVRHDPEHRVETWLLNQIEIPTALRAEVDHHRYRVRTAS